MNIHFYLDEDVDTSLSGALKRRSINATTTQDAENCGLSDYRQLIYARDQDRTIITHNTRDFVILHKTSLNAVVCMLVLSFVSSNRSAYCLEE